MSLFERGTEAHRRAKPNLDCLTRTLSRGLIAQAEGGEANPGRMMEQANPHCGGCWREGAIVFQLGLARLCWRYWLVLVIVLIGAALVLLQGGWDHRVLHSIRVPGNRQLTHLADTVSFWGDEIWSLGLASVLWSAGALFKRRRWRRLGWACLWAFLIASATMNVARFSLGRARPDSGLADGFYGPHFKSKYRGFPSGHATNSFATAAAVFSTSPALGLPCGLYASAVGWSRLQLNHHYPLDVLTGAALGGFIGWCFGSALPGARFWLQRKRRAKGAN